jgi:hypothetical protein
MFYYLHNDGFFDHFYRSPIKLTNETTSVVHDVLHVNATSPLINTVDIRFHDDFIGVSEKEFDKALNNVIETLGINLKKFTFV